MQARLRRSHRGDDTEWDTFCSQVCQPLYSLALDAGLESRQC